MSTDNGLEGLEDQLKVERRKVDVDNVSFSVRELVRMAEEGELSIAPAYQRKYRWPQKVASAFVESIFLGLPVPPIFVATNDDYGWEVVDGVQRISTLIRFVSNDPEALEMIGKDTSLELGEMEKLTQLNGQTFDSLPVPLQRFFGRQAVQVISLSDKSDKDVRFSLFERLNSGSIALTPQEVRAAVYRGDFITFLEKLSQHPEFRSLLKLQETNQNDGTSAEQALKFFAYKNFRDHFKGAVTSFLNQYTGMASESFDFHKEKRIFEDTVAFVAEAVNGPFLRNRTSVTPLVQFEAVMIAVAEIIEGGSQPQIPAEDWLNDEVLIKASTGATNTRKKLNERINRARELFGETAS